MSNRRKFLQNISITALGAMAFPKIVSGKKVFERKNPNSVKGFPMVISTWKHGLPANEAAMKILKNGGKAIDAVEAGVRVPESDPENTSVGYGGFPDRDGNVTLDACIMDDVAPPQQVSDDTRYIDLQVCFNNLRRIYMYIS